MTKMIIKVTIGLLLIAAWVSIPAFATDYGNDEAMSQEQLQLQKQLQGQAQGQLATGGAATSSNEGINIDTSETSNIENNSSNTVLVPNNNTENCLRVFGIAWGKNGESGALGLPWRSKKCDFEQAADDAFAAGERESGWFWKCQNSNLYKQFKKKNVSTEMAQESCLAKMVGEVRAMQRIETLTTQLTEINTLRENELTQYRESRERLTEACNDSKNRMLESCKQDK